MSLLRKSDLRARLKLERLKFSGEERQAKSELINERLLEVIDWSTVKKLHYYEPLISLGEVDITGFIAQLGRSHPGIDLFTSRKLDNAWRIVRPDSEEPVQAVAFDVIIVPMLGFDPKTLHRLGYGGGYYDILLHGQPQAQKIGVCYEQGSTPNLPTEPHDIPLDQIITES